jgi:hypothetical protein
MGMRVSTRIFPPSITEIASEQKFVDKSASRAALISCAVGVVTILCGAGLSIGLQRADVFFGFGAFGLFIVLALYVSRKRWIENPAHAFLKKYVLPEYKPFRKELLTAGFSSAYENVPRVAQLLCEILGRSVPMFEALEKLFHFEVCALLRLARLKQTIGNEPELKGMFVRLEKIHTQSAIVNLKVIQKRLEILEVLNQTALELSTEIKQQRIESSNYLAMSEGAQKANHEPHVFLQGHKERLDRLSIFVGRLEKVVLVDGLPEFVSLEKELDTSSEVYNKNEMSKTF